MRTTAAVFSVLVILGGCTKLGPDFTQPAAPVLEGWSTDASEAGFTNEPSDPAAWWSVFEDPVLEGLIERARSDNLDLMTAGLRVMEARAALGIAIGGKFPQIQEITGGVSRNRVSENAANAAAANRSFDDLQAGFNAAWEIDFWGKFERAIEAADAGLAAEIARFDDVLVTLTSDVASFYIRIRELQERIRLTERNVALQTRTLKIADARFRAGAVSELDVQQARGLLNDTKATLPVLSTSLRQAQNALSVLLGVPPYDLSSEIGDETAIPAAPGEVALGVPADLLRRRPDIRVAEQRAAAQSARIGIARADLYPAFSLGGFIGLQSSNSGGAASNNANFSDLFSADSLAGFIGPSFRWPIFNYGRLTNNVRVQDARFQQALTQYEQTVLRAYRETEDALVAFVQSQRRDAFLARSVNASRRSVDLALLEYREGLIDYQRVVDTQNVLVRRQDLHAENQGAIARNLVQIFRSLGGGWESHDKPLVPAEILEEMQVRTDWGDLLPDGSPPEPMAEKTEELGILRVRQPAW